MSECSLAGRRILLLEDEYIVAILLETELNDAGAIVLGPLGKLENAIDLIKSGEPIDAAILDLNIRGELSYPAADLLSKRGVPFIFTTGYDGSAMPSEYANFPRCEKPVSASKVVLALQRLLTTHPGLN